MPVSSMESLTRKGQATRRGIEASARDLFADKGYLRTTVADITTAAGLSTAAFYRYFDGKEDLLLSLADSLAAQVFELASIDAPPHTEHLAYLRAATKAYWAIYRENAGVYSGLFQLAMVDDQARQTWLRLREEGVRSIDRSLAQAAGQGYAPVPDTRAAAEAISSMFEHACFMWLGSGGQPRDDGSAIAALTTAWYRISCFPA